MPQKEQTLIAKQLAGDEPIPTSQLGAVVRFIKLDDESVDKAIANGDMEFVATILSTTVESLIARRNRALGRSTPMAQAVPAITKLAKVSDEEYRGLIDSGRIDFMATLWGIPAEELSRRRTAQRLRLDLARKPAMAAKGASKKAQSKASQKRRGNKRTIKTGGVEEAEGQAKESD